MQNADLNKENEHLEKNHSHNFKSISHSLKSNQKKAIFYLFALYVFFILVFGLWPFNFHSKNNVDWLKTENGLSFNKHGIVYASSRSDSKNPIPYYGKDGEISIELWLKPESNVPKNSAYILCVFDDFQQEIFSLSQVKSLLKISIPDSVDSTPNWRWLHNTFFEGQQVWLAITSNRSKTIVYLDGKIAGQYWNYSLVPEKRKSVEWQFVLGNNSFGQKPWIGKIYGLAIYNHLLTPKKVLDHYQKWKIQGARSLSKEKNIIALYPMNEQTGEFVHNVLDDHYHFFIPHRFNSPQKKFIAIPRNLFQLDRIEIRDMGINSFGFIPFGFLFFRVFISKMKSDTRFWQLVFIAVLTGAVLSFAVEGLQTFLPTRYSSLRDVIFNILGTGVGALLAAGLVKKNMRYVH